MNHIKNIAVIGCGWLGYPLAKHFVHNGYKVIATHRSARHPVFPAADGIRWIQLVLQPEFVCSNPGPLCSADLAVILLPPRAGEHDSGNYVDRIRNLITALKPCGLDKTILVSSTSVYPLLNREVDESDSALPDSDSGRSLLHAESLLSGDPGLKCMIVRFAGLCGPGREPGRLLAGRTGVRGGSNPVNLIHQQDAIGILQTLVEKQPWGETYNGCAPVHPKKSDLYPDAARALGLAPPSFDFRSVPYKQIQAKKICTQLGFRYRYPDPAKW